MRSDFLKHSGIMLLAMGLVNLFNLLFHLFMVRNLATIDYGILNSLFAMFMIISVPAATIQTVIAKFVSHLQAVDRLEKIKFLIWHLGKRVLMVAMSCFLILIITRTWLADFLKLPGNQFVIVLGASLTFAIILPVFLGGLQGLQKFDFLGVNMIIGGGAKLILGIVLVLFGFRVMGALGALLAAGAIQIFLSFLSLKYSMRIKQNIDYRSLHGMKLVEVYKFFYPVALAYLCFMMLTNSDILLVKHFFSPLDAGHYSVASMVGKMILFLPAAISIVMFPKTSKLHAEEKSSIAILKKSLLYSGSLCLIAGLVFAFYPIILVMLLSVKETGIFIPLARLFIIAMVCFALIYVIMLYNLSIHKIKFLYILIMSLLLQIIFIWVFHNSLVQVISIVAINACLLFGIILWMTYRESRRKAV